MKRHRALAATVYALCVSVIVMLLAILPWNTFNNNNNKQESFSPLTDNNNEQKQNQEENTAEKSTTSPSPIIKSISCSSIAKTAAKANFDDGSCKEEEKEENTRVAEDDHQRCTALAFMIASRNLDGMLLACRLRSER